MSELDDISNLVAKKVKNSDEEEWLKELALKLVKHEIYHDTTGREGYQRQFKNLAEKYVDKVK